MPKVHFRLKLKQLVNFKSIPGCVVLLDPFKQPNVTVGAQKPNFPVQVSTKVWFQYPSSNRYFILWNQTHPFLEELAY